MRVLVSAAFVCFVGCGYGTPLSVNGSARGALAGRAVKGPVAGGKVTAYRLDEAMRRGEALAEGVTDEAGAFTLSLPAYNGSLLLAVSSGGYTEEATGTPVRLDGHELTAAVVGYHAGAHVDGALLTPISHWIAALAGRYVSTEGRPVGEAVVEAAQHLNAHFGGVDWSKTAPADLTTSRSPQLDDPAKAGLVLCALSMQARGIAEAAGLTPGSALNTMTLVEALADDLGADGYFDGVGAAGPILLPAGTATSSVKLDGQTVRLSLALASQRFLRSSRNVSPFTDTDTRQLRFDLASDSNPRLFRDSGSTYDTEPPLVSLAGDGPARWTRANTVSFAVLADDGAGTGVKQVFARNGRDSAPVPGVFSEGVWRFADLALRTGPNVISVWAEDNATPSNSGAGRGLPAELSIAIGVDTGSPAPAFTPVQSYVDERGLALVRQIGSTGVPPKYATPATPRIALGPNDVIWKASTRLSWGPQSPTGSELESTNSLNLPFLQISVPVDPDTDSPLEDIRYSISASCEACPAIATSTGSLLTSPRAETQRTFFDLPITAETVPALTSAVSSPVKLSISVTVTDGAGNIGRTVNDVVVFFHVIGPPIYWREEPGYGAVADPRSAFAYRSTDASYGSLWTPSTTITSNTNGPPHYAVRVVRYILGNPYAAPIAVRADAIGAAEWTAYERWDQEILGHASSFSMDGYQFTPSYTRRDTECPFGYYQRHAPGYSGRFECVPLPYPSAGSGAPVLIEHSSSLTASAFSSPQPSGVERQVAPNVGDWTGANYWIIPPAQGQTPGEIVVYIERPGVQRPYAFETFATSTDHAYRTTNWDYYVEASAFDCVGIDGATCFEYRAYRFANKLVDATENVSGFVLWRTSGLRADGWAIGDLLLSGTQQFNRSVQH